MLFCYSGDLNQPENNKEGNKVVCYFPNWAKYREAPYTFTPTSINPDLCTHIIWSFISIENKLPKPATQEEAGDCECFTDIDFFVCYLRIAAIGLFSVQSLYLSSGCAIVVDDLMFSAIIFLTIISR